MAKKASAIEIKKASKPGNVMVKILKHVGAYSPGDEVEVDKKTADHLCHVNEIDDGCGNIVVHKRAILLEEYKDLEAESAKVENLTAGEAAALGIKNVVDSSGSKISEVNLIPPKDEK